MKKLFKAMQYIYGMPCVCILDLIGAKQTANKLFNYLENYCL